MRYTQQLWQSIEPIFKAILKHPFLKELADGSLAQTRFAFYLQQDALYLKEFSKLLALAGVKAERTEELQHWLTFALEAVQAEQMLHQHYFKEFAIIPSAKPSLACSSYINFLLATASTRSYAEIAAALLPCFWIYWEAGKALNDHNNHKNPYAAWLKLYSGTAFADSVQTALYLTEQAAARESRVVRKHMQELFVTASRFEWAFWDSAYQMNEKMISFSMA